MMRRQRAPWMTGSDDKILELLGESGVALNKRGIEVNFELGDEEISYSTIKRRLPKFVEAGLVEKVEAKGLYYQITEDGRQYLAGELNVKDSLNSI